MRLSRMDISGFDFSNCKRNNWLEKSTGVSNLPKAKKTGTTIVGVVFKDGVVLGADTRSTMGSIIADKNCEKIHYIAPNIYCCGAGTAADTENVTKMISAELELLRMNENRGSRVVAALKSLKEHLFKYQGHIGAAMILGGVDCCGPHLFSCSPHAHSDKLPFTTMGSGCLASMAFFEKNYRDDMDEEQACRFVVDGITAGIENDLGSGSNVDLCIIKSSGIRFLRNHEIVGYRRDQFNYEFEEGTTAVANKVVYPHIEIDVVGSSSTVYQEYTEVAME